MPKRTPPAPAKFIEAQAPTVRALEAIEPDTYTVEEVARKLQLSEHGVRNAIARNEVPGVVRIGRRIRISRRVFDRWLEEAATPELEAS